jgi:NAD(P)-dependent dehydrogenase (short-subunit alcohol dehydrogenase family)
LVLGQEAYPPTLEYKQGFVASFAKARPKALVLVGRDAAQLAEAAQDVRAVDANIEVLAVPTDISDEAAVAALFDKVQGTYGHADVLVNNAGALGGGALGDTDPAAWWRVMVRNFFSYPLPFSTLHEVLSCPISPRCPVSLVLPLRAASVHLLFQGLNSRLAQRHLCLH